MFSIRHYPFPRLTDPQLQRHYVDDDIVEVSDDLFSSAAMGDHNLLHDCFDRPAFLEAMIRIADDESNPIYLSFEVGDESMLRTWRSCGVNVAGWFSEKGSTLMHLGAMSGMSLEMLESEQYLLEVEGINILLARDISGDTPVHTLIRRMAERGVSGGRNYSGRPMETDVITLKRWIGRLQNAGKMGDLLPEPSDKNNVTHAMFGPLARAYWSLEKSVKTWAPHEAYVHSPLPLLHVAMSTHNFIAETADILTEAGLKPGTDFWQRHEGSYGLSASQNAMRWMAKHYPETCPDPAETFGTIQSAVRGLADPKRSNSSHLSELYNFFDAYGVRALPSSAELRAGLIRVLLADPKTAGRDSMTTLWAHTNDQTLGGIPKELQGADVKALAKLISDSSREQRKIWEEQLVLDRMVAPAVVEAPRKRM